MPCYHPLTGYPARQVNESGKRSLVFDIESALVPVATQVPCGRCIGCRLDRSLAWAIRCVHEASLYDDNCFITLTFNDEHLHEKRSLEVADFQKFMKRLRKLISPRKVRFFHCGEYGAKLSRPHHHACLFNYDFPDKKFWTERNGVKLYTSEILDSLWSIDGKKLGFCSIGAVTFESAAYVARYVMKKWSRDNLKGEELYGAMQALQWADASVSQKMFEGSAAACEAAELYYGGRRPEYITMSRRPGIGEGWFNKYASDLYPGGFAIVNGKKVKVPKYYDKLLEEADLWTYAKVKGQRIAAAAEDPDNTRARLATREVVVSAKVNKFLQRSIHGEENVFGF